MQTNTTQSFAEVTVIETAPVTDLVKMPYIRVDSKGRILYANEASNFILNGMNSKRDFIPTDFINRIPGMLNLNADFSVPVELSSKTIMLDIIGFEECGYISLYSRAE